MAGGWIAVVIILVIVLIGGFIAVIFNSSEDENYDTSQFPNSEIVFVAKAQIGNVGGEKFWRWYGFNDYVYWCACYTVEGNTNNSCAERMYSFEDRQVMGYGSPKY